MARKWMVVVALLAADAAAVDIGPCLDCHRAGPAQSAPVLEGQSRPYLANQLARFREHVRESFPMGGLAQGLDDDAIAALAADLAQRDWVAVASRADAAARAAGESLVTRHDCAACHGADFRGGGDIPRLAGQRVDYLARQIESFADGERFHPPTGAGSHMYRLDSAEAAALAAWLGNLR